MTFTKGAGPQVSICAKMYFKVNLKLIWGGSCPNYSNESFFVSLFSGKAPHLLTILQHLNREIQGRTVSGRITQNEVSSRLQINFEIHCLIKWLWCGRTVEYGILLLKFKGQLSIAWKTYPLSNILKVPSTFLVLQLNKSIQNKMLTSFIMSCS